MRIRWRSASVAAVACVALVRPLAGSAAELRTLAGVPRASLDDARHALTRQIMVTLDDPRFALDLSAPACAQAPAMPASPTASPPVGCGSASTLPSLHEPAIAATAKLPPWPIDGPYVDVTLRRWTGDTLRDGTRSSHRGVDAEVELTQPLGAHDLVAGYSHPLGAGADRWRAVWVGATFTLSARMRLRLMYESAHDVRSAASDTRYTVRLAYGLGESLRLVAYLVDAPEEAIGRWRGGAGVDWSF